MALSLSPQCWNDLCHFTCRNQKHIYTHTYTRHCDTTPHDAHAACQHMAIFLFNLGSTNQFNVLFYRRCNWQKLEHLNASICWWEIFMAESYQSLIFRLTRVNPHFFCFSLPNQSHDGLFARFCHCTVAANFGKLVRDDCLDSVLVCISFFFFFFFFENLHLMSHISFRFRETQDTRNIHTKKASDLAAATLQMVTVNIGQFLQQSFCGGAAGVLFFFFFMCWCQT